MKGIQFVVDEAGKKKAVLIDLEEWGELWEDFYDLMVTKSRQHEASVDWHEVKTELAKGATEPKGVSGKELLSFSGAISNSDATRISKVIEEGCEQVDVNEW